MDGPENALVAAVIARLKADPAVSALVGARVWDQPAEDADFPQLLVGRSESRPVDADGGGVEQVLTLSGVSRFEGAEEARAIAAAVRACLHHAPLEPAGLRLVSLRVVYVDVFRGADHRRTYAVIRLRAVTEQL
jgi:hypothetical protein